MESPSGKIERSEDIYNYFSESILGAIQDIILRRLLNSIVSRLVVLFVTTPGWGVADPKKN